MSRFGSPTTNNTAHKTFICCVPCRTLNITTLTTPGVCSYTVPSFCSRGDGLGWPGMKVSLAAGGGGGSSGLKCAIICRCAADGCVKSGLSVSYGSSNGSNGGISCFGTFGACGGSGGCVGQFLCCGSIGCACVTYTTQFSQSFCVTANFPTGGYGAGTLYCFCAQTFGVGGSPFGVADASAPGVDGSCTFGQGPSTRGVGYFLGCAASFGSCVFSCSIVGNSVTICQCCSGSGAACMGASGLGVVCVIATDAWCGGSFRGVATPYSGPYCGQGGQGGYSFGKMFYQYDGVGCQVVHIGILPFALISGSSGGSGGTASKTFTKNSITPGCSINVCVGAGGAGGAGWPSVNTCYYDCCYRSYGCTGLSTCVFGSTPLFYSQGQCGTDGCITICYWT